MKRSPDQRADEVRAMLRATRQMMEVAHQQARLAVERSRAARKAVRTPRTAELEQALTLFVWSKSRVVPVRLTEFSITEEAFDPNLNPIRAKVSLGMRVLNVDDLGFSHPGGRLFMTYLTNKQQLASKAPSAELSVLGLGGIF